LSESNGDGDRILEAFSKRTQMLSRERRGRMVSISFSLDHRLTPHTPQRRFVLRCRLCVECPLYHHARAGKKRHRSFHGNLADTGELRGDLADLQAV
jgi:hypothetical protein